MINIKKSWQLFRRNQQIWPEGTAGLARISHRDMVGGMWDEIGRMQFDFMLDVGLNSDDILLEVGCGCFRAGRFFIGYLNSGNYIGLDKEQALIDVGKNEELTEDLISVKKPKFIITDSFDLTEVTSSPNFVIAQSLFTHLTLRDIGKCLLSLSKISDTQTRLFCTIFESQSRLIHFDESHSGKNFEYTQKQMQKIGFKNGWKMSYIGDWGHPRNQKMIEYTLL